MNIERVVYTRQTGPEDSLWLSPRPIPFQSSLMTYGLNPVFETSPLVHKSILSNPNFELSASGPRSVFDVLPRRDLPGDLKRRFLPAAPNDLAKLPDVDQLVGRKQIRLAFGRQLSRDSQAQQIRVSHHRLTPQK